MEQAEVFQLGNIGGAIVCLASYVVIALVIGIGSGRAIARRFGSARTGRAVGASCGLMLGAGLMTAFHHTSLDGFYRLESQGEKVHVHWMFPPDSRTLDRSDIARVGFALAHHGQRRLVLELNDGSRLLSARDAKEQVTLALAAFRPPTRPAGDSR